MASDSEIEVADAEGYADKYGVSLAVAMDRLSYQGSIGVAISDLRSDEAATFGGAWVEHSPGWKVVVRTIREGPSTESVEAYFTGIPIHVEVLRGARGQSRTPSST